MQAIAAYIMRGRFQAMLMTAGLGLLSVLLMPLSWPLSYLSAGSVVLVTLMQGQREGLYNVAGATALVAVLMGISFGQPVMAIGFGLVLWLPALLLALLLYRTRSLALTLAINALLGIVLITGIYLLQGDPAGWWYGYITGQVIPAMKQANLELPQEILSEQMLRQSAAMMTGVMVASISMGLSISVLVGRWWQSVISRPGAFGEEFRQLRMGLLASVVLVVLFALSLLASGQLAEWASNAMLVAMVVFLFQGLAVGHALVRQSGAGQGWLVMMYILLVFSMPFGFYLAVGFGLLDNSVDFRARFRKSKD